MFQGLFSDPRVLDALVELLPQPDDLVRMHALYALRLVLFGNEITKTLFVERGGLRVTVKNTLERG